MGVMLFGDCLVVFFLIRLKYFGFVILEVFKNLGKVRNFSSGVK